MNIIPYKQVSVLAIVKEDRNVFDAACEMNNVGLLVEMVLPRTRTVTGMCTRSVKDKLDKLDFLESVELEEQD